MRDQSMGKTSTEDLRREYARQSLSEGEVADDPIEQFERWFREARESDLPDVTAMTLATATKEGQPSARTVLLKGFDAYGFRFYTNYASRKARELNQNPQAALCFYWQPLERQVRIEGRVEKLSKKDSARYFAKRPRKSQLGAWASRQSARVESRDKLEEKFARMKKKFEDQEVPLPDFWGGYLLKPARLEFWQGRPGRLHDRIVYNRGKNGWEISRLAP